MVSIYKHTVIKGDTMDIELRIFAALALMTVVIGITTAIAVRDYIDNQ
jgi:hypothetical protein